MASTTHDDGFHEIQLNGKQLVFLFMAGTVVAVVIFLLGVFVGRGVSAQVTTPIDPLASQEPAAAPPEAPPAVPPPAASAESSGPVAGNDKLDYPSRLLPKDAPKERLTPAPATPPATPPKAPARPETKTASAPAATSSVASEPAGDGFAIQVAALAKREEAEAVVRRLTGKGYSAYMISPGSTSPLFRVRVGKFKERREAESVASRLQKEEQFKPWIAR